MLVGDMLESGSDQIQDVAGSGSGEIAVPEAARQAAYNYPRRR